MRKPIETLTIRDFQTPRYSNDPRNRSEDPYCEYSDEDPSVDVCEKCSCECDERIEK